MRVTAAGRGDDRPEGPRRSEPDCGRSGPCPAADRIRPTATAVPLAASRCLPAGRGSATPSYQSPSRKSVLTRAFLMWIRFQLKYQLERHAQAPDHTRRGPSECEAEVGQRLEWARAGFGRIKAGDTEETFERNMPVKLCGCV